MVFSLAVQTTKNKQSIPPHIHECWEKYFHGKRYVFDDNECIQFLHTHYGPSFVDKFHYLKQGAHKADLFRYAWLYKHGGIYCDIKTILIRPMNEVFTDKNTCYFVNTRTKGYPYLLHNRIYNGIIATPPHNPLIYKMLQVVMNHYNSYPYIDICKRSYSVIYNAVDITPFKFMGSLHPKQPNHVPPVYIFTEEMSIDCNGKYDRMGFCNWVVDENRQEKMFFVRDINYNNKSFNQRILSWYSHKYRSLYLPIQHVYLLVKSVFYLLFVFLFGYYPI